MNEIRTIAVIGAGNMGSGIAQKYAAEGFPVVLLDLDQASLDRGVARIESTLKEAVERRIYKPEQAAAIQGRITPTADVAGLAEVDLAVEAVFEDLEVKRGVFARLAQVMRNDAVIGTNTSSFYVRDLTEGIANPGRIVGLHYFYHPAKNRLVEVIPGPETPDGVFAAVWSLQERIGKTPIRSADQAGFIVNRFFVPWINEAARLLEEGIADIPTIEQAAIEAFKIGMGPFQLMNLTGIPIGYHAAATLEKRLGAFYAPSGKIREYMQTGRQFDLAGEPRRERFTDVAERLLGVVFHVATQLVSERVGTIEDTDIGARVGLRWAKGPFEMMNRVGLNEAFRITRALEQRYGLSSPDLMREQVKLGTPFPIELVRSETKGGIATLTFNRPDAMNALNPEVMRQLSQKVESAITDPAVRGIVLAGAGKAFVAGADIVFFVKNIEKGAFADIQRFAEDGQKLCRRLESCGKPVVCRLDGLALGGGLELALSCDRIVATDKATVAFPETGIGIFPGLGGTQRTSRRIGVALTRWLVYTGRMVDMRTAEKIGLVDRVVPHAELEAALIAAVDAGKVDRQGLARPGVSDAAQGEQGLALTAAFFDQQPLETLLTGAPDLGVSSGTGSGSGTGTGSGSGGGANPVAVAEAEKTIAQLRKRSFAALRVAQRLIDAGAALPLEQGLALELEAMEATFRHPDAKEGLSALLERRAAQFQKS
ncbi:MAG: enoyl-CoA hydratase/isomerase family protein [Candidatus Eisenbacteria bacterium]|nr:enoyl-CoA hydratase/isomerase family protein [Candidatus Eisenbacteria bacterium]